MVACVMMYRVVDFFAACLGYLRVGQYRVVTFSTAEIQNHFVMGVSLMEF